MLGLRSVGRLPGRLASSSCSASASHLCSCSLFTIATASSSVGMASGSPRLRRLRRFLLPGERGDDGVSKEVGSDG